VTEVKNPTSIDVCNINLSISGELLIMESILPYTSFEREK